MSKPPKKVFFVIYPKRMRNKKVVFVRLELTTFTLQHNALPARLCWTHCFWYSWSWLFIYLSTAGKYIHEATHNHFVAHKRKKTTTKKVVREAWTHDLHVTTWRSIIPKKKEKLSLWGFFFNRDRDSLCHPLLLLTRCLNRAWLVILQPILHRKPVRTDLLLCDRWQASAQACICC